MKNWHGWILAAAIIAVCAWPLIAAEEGQAPRPGQGQGQGGQGRGGYMMGRESQMQAIDAMQAELAKMKQAFDNVPDRQSMQELTEEQRTAMRERFTQMREEREKSVAVLEKSMAQLKGARTLTREHDEAVAVLKAIHEQAVKEEAKETAAQIEKLIAEKNKAFEEKMSSLGMEPMRRESQGRAPRQAPQ